MRRIDRPQLQRALWLALTPGAALFAIMQTSGYARAGTLGLDSHAYWLAAGNPSGWYTLPPAYTDAYLYSPVFAQVIAPLGALPWPVFQIVWATLGAAALVWLLWPLGRWKGTVVGLFLCPDLLIGNVYSLFAVALVLSVRGWSGALALPALTKVGPAVVGLWHMVRGEWRAVGWAIGTTGVVVALSYAASPDAWARWLQFLGESADTRGVGSTVRVGIAAVLTVYAGRSGRAWLLAPATLLACPVLGGYAAFAVLAAIPRLRRWERRIADDEVSGDVVGAQGYDSPRVP